MEIVPLLCYRGEWRISGTKEGRPLDFYENREENRLQAAIGWIVDVIVMVLLAAFAVYCFGTRVQMRGSSMRPALESGDVVLINRLAYDLGSPKRFDIAAFARDDSSFNIRRVIGLPGDKIEIRKADESEYVTAAEVTEVPPGSLDNVDPSAKLVTAAVYVNGERLEEDYIKEPMLYMGDQTFEVPEGCYFMLGDNRNNSEDARFWNDPYISKDKMIAKVLFRYWPGIKWLDD